MVEVKNLVKRYGNTTALAGLSFSLQPASFNALLGPNGAGKSTLFQILTGLYSPDQGEVRIGPYELRTQPSQTLAQLGVVFQNQSLDLDLTVEQNWRFQAALHGLSKSTATQEIQFWSKQFDFESVLGKPARELSGGNRRKVELARALLARPSVLLMDEATVGLDPKSRQDLLKCLHQLIKETQLTVLWATHLVQEAEQAHRVLLLAKGKLLADGTPQQLVEQAKADNLEHAFLKMTQAKEAA